MKASRVARSWALAAPLGQDDVHRTYALGSCAHATRPAVGARRAQRGRRTPPARPTPRAPRPPRPTAACRRGARACARGPCPPAATTSPGPRGRSASAMAARRSGWTRNAEPSTPPAATAPSTIRPGWRRASRCGVVLGEDRQVGTLDRGRAEARACRGRVRLRAPTTTNSRRPGRRAQGRERLGERAGGVGEVDDDAERLGRDHLHAARHAGEVGEALQRASRTARPASGRPRARRARWRR
jgi:hypothetical protein